MEYFYIYHPNFQACVIPVKENYTVVGLFSLYIVGSKKKLQFLHANTQIIYLRCKYRTTESLYRNKNTKFN